MLVALQRSHSELETPRLPNLLGVQKRRLMSLECHLFRASDKLNNLVNNNHLEHMVNKFSHSYI